MKNFLRQPQTTTQRPTGLCIDERNAQVVIADYASDGGFDIHRAMIDERRAVNITTGLLRTVVGQANAHTQYSQLGATASDSDEVIVNELLSTMPQDAAYITNFTRTSNGRVLLTQADELAIGKANQQLKRWLENQQPEHIQTPASVLRVETRTRAIARLWHSMTAEHPETETVAFLVITNDDYAVGLWSEDLGLVYETEERFESGANHEIKCHHARDIFAKLIATGTLDNLQLPPVTKAIVSALDDYEELIIALLTTSEELSHIEISPVSLDLSHRESSKLDQPTALAIGVLLDNPAIPPCDLNITLTEQLEEINRVLSEQHLEATDAKVMRAALAFLIPIVAVAAFMIASYVDHVVERARLQSRIDTENQTAQKLARDNADYESSKANFATFQTLLDNLIGLRQRQPAAHQLLRDLNQRWPQDPTWFVSEINVKGGSVEIKGKTKNEQAITSFAKSLEFSDGLFTGILAKNGVQGAGLNSAPAQPTASNIIEFTVLATYAPLAQPGKAQTAPRQPVLQSPSAIPLAPNMVVPQSAPPQQPGMQSGMKPPITIPTPVGNQPNVLTGVKQ